MGSPDVVARLYGFVAAVRRAGVPVAPDRVQALLRALDVTGPEGLYWAGRLTLCGTPDDVARYDAVWHQQAAGDAGSGRTPPGSPPVRRLVAAGLGDGGAAGELGAEVGVAARASADEVLRHRDVADLTEAERAEVRRMLALLAPATPARPARRRQRDRAGRVDPRRTLRATLRHLGEPARLARHRPGRRARRLVLLLDVSGSMAPYADALLRFAHAAVRVRPATTEVFTIGTRLTRVTPALRHADPAAAVRLAGTLVPDWRGGTRLGAGLSAYLRSFGHRGMARRALVVVCSDGWERGDASELAAAAAWLSRLAHRVVWVTPHADREGFAPTVSGLAAVLPYVDELVAGHSVAAFARLARLIGA